MSKVYLHYEPEKGEQYEAFTYKLNLDEQWKAATAEEVCSYFVNEYKKKYDTCTWNDSEMQWVKSNGNKVEKEEIVAMKVTDGEDLYLKSGEPKLMKCRNFGCQKKYFEKENHEKACRHHTKPPTFHDTKKGWGCCSNKMVYDWDEFEKIPTCALSRHCDIPPQKRVLAASSDEKAADAAPTVPNSAPVAAPAAPVVTAPSTPLTIEDYNRKNPNATTAASSIAKATAKKPPAKRADGKIRCKNFGCRQLYVDEENNEEACLHHASGPVFHDSGKYWSCCPKLVKYDFDEFLTIPGCVKSCHSDGSK